MTIILIILLLFAFANFMSIVKPFIKEDREQYDHAYYRFKNHKYFRDYTGICFNGIKEAFVLLRYQTGVSYDREITICNISFIFPKKEEWN